MIHKGSLIATRHRSPQQLCRELSQSILHTGRIVESRLHDPADSAYQEPVAHHDG
jgi:hypothetical protein